MARQPVSSSSTSPRDPSRPSTRDSIKAFKSASPQDLFWDLLTFDRLMTGPVIHIIYWAGLALLLLGGFSVIGGAFGVALREEGLMRWMLAFPLLVIGLLVLVAGLLLWRSFCEFYVAVFRIADDLQAMRAKMDNVTLSAQPIEPQPQPKTTRRTSPPSGLEL